MQLPTIYLTLSFVAYYCPRINTEDARASMLANKVMAPSVKGKKKKKKNFNQGMVRTKAME